MSSSATFQKPIIPFSQEEVEEIQAKLDAKLDPDDISFRPSAQGNVAYLEGWKAFNLANQVFGFNGWSSEIHSFTTDFIDEEAGRISVGMSCMVRIYLRDGTYHEDIGYGSSENQRSKAAAFEKAKKEAVTDAMKRALRIFGNKLGNCAYDKVFLRQLKSGGGPKPPISIPPPAVPPNPSNAKRPQADHPPFHAQAHPPPDFVPRWQSPKVLLEQRAVEPAITNHRPQQTKPATAQHPDSPSRVTLTEEQFEAMFEAEGFSQMPRLDSDDHAKTPPPADFTVHRPRHQPSFQNPQNVFNRPPR